MDHLKEPRASWTGGRRAGFIAGVAAGVFATGLVVGIILAGLGAAGAQTSSPSPSPSSGSETRPFLPPFGGFHGGWFGHTGFGPGILHGQFTTTAPGGGY